MLNPDQVEIQLKAYHYDYPLFFGKGLNQFPYPDTLVRCASVERFGKIPLGREVPVERLLIICQSIVGAGLATQS